MVPALVSGPYNVSNILYSCVQVDEFQFLLCGCSSFLQNNVFKSYIKTTFLCFNGSAIYFVFLSVMEYNSRLFVPFYFSSTQINLLFEPCGMHSKSNMLLEIMFIGKLLQVNQIWFLACLMIMSNKCLLKCLKEYLKNLTLWYAFCQNY